MSNTICMHCFLYFMLLNSVTFSLSTISFQGENQLRKKINFFFSLGLRSLNSFAVVLITPSRFTVLIAILINDSSFLSLEIAFPYLPLCLGDIVRHFGCRLCLQSQTRLVRCTLSMGNNSSLSHLHSISNKFTC